MSEDLDTVHGSSNVFRDFGCPVADIRQARGILAACMVGSGRFTLDRLIHILGALDTTLEITVDVHQRTAG